MRSKQERQGLVVCLAIVVWLIANNTGRDIRWLNYATDRNESDIRELTEKFEQVDEQLNYPGQGLQEVREAVEANDSEIGELQSKIEDLESKVNEVYYR
jgi:phage shock protein A